MNDFLNMDEYLKELSERGDLPEGFQISSISLSFFPKEKKSKSPYNMNLSFIKADKPTEVFGALFTQNKFPGAPVTIGKAMLQNKEVQGIVINNRIANVAAPSGIETAKKIVSTVADCAGIGENAIFPSSTGIIGWSLPEKEMIESVPPLVNALGVHNGSLLAKAIMTTDSFPKLRSVKIGSGKIWAVAKGAGMIEPNMATMLCFILTDLDVSREFLQSSLEDAVKLSFNRISVDSDQSTSDSVIMMSSCKYKIENKEEFRFALIDLLKELSIDVVRNGEGTAHVMRVEVKGFESDQIAVEAGKAVVNSSLVKTAIFGNDPNVGRMLSAIGDWGGNYGVDICGEELVLSIGGEEVYSNGEFLLDEEKEIRLYQYLLDCELTVPSVGFPEHNKCVEILIEAKGKGHAIVYGSDLSYEYIRENAEYRS